MSRSLAALVIGCLCASSLAAPPDTAQAARRIYEARYAARLVPLLLEVLRFPTVAGNDAARDAQQAWVRRTGAALGLAVRDAGLVTEVELAGPAGAPVLGLVAHGDVQPVSESEWSVPPFAGVEKDGVVYGRGAADDKNAIVQAMLAMAALRDSGAARSYTLRLLVGSDEESSNEDFRSYLKDHAAPDLSLVLDSAFPAVVGEKAWTAYTVTAAQAFELRAPARGQAGYALASLEAGLAPSIVPSRAQAVLQWQGPPDGAAAAFAALQAVAVPAGYRLALEGSAQRVHLTVAGRAAHAGVNIEGGRNALVLLARVLQDRLLDAPAAELLRFAGAAGADLYGTGLGLDQVDPVWGRYAVNVAMLQADAKEPSRLTLTINIRALPQLWGEPLHAFLDERLARFNAQHGEQFSSGGFFADAPLVIDTHAKLVERLMADYARATGTAAPWAISGGGTYAKRLPNAIAFGMWFPGKPYPGHDVDEQISVEDLQRGTRVLIETLADLATGAPLRDPLQP
jgi:succinyl-diaminopimelate desuccinylase